MTSRIKIIIAQIILLIVVQNLSGQNTWILKGGINYSRIYDINSNGQYNYLIGIEKQLHIGNILSINPEILFAKQSSIIKNKPVWTDAYNEYLYYYDIHIIRTSSNFSLILDFQLYNSEDLNFSIRLFPSFYFENLWNTEIVERQLIDKNNGNIDWDNYDFEYRQGDFENFLKLRTGWSLNFGFMIKYLRFITELRYLNKLSPIGQAGQLVDVNHKIHSFGLIFGYIF